MTAARIAKPARITKPLLTAASFAAALGATTLALPATAHADILTFYAGAKADYVSGSGDVYERFESSMGYGAFLGIEVVGLDLWGEALIMGDGQYLFTGNLGIDLSFGDDIRFIVGIDTGPMIFRFPEESAKPLVIPAGVRSVIGEDTASEIEAEYDEFLGLEEEASRWALGWNIARARLQVEAAMVPRVVFVGVGANAGYHYLLNGEEVAADTKSGAIDRLENDYPEAKQAGAFEQLRKEVNARELDTDELHGINYNVGAYIRVEL